MKPPITFVELDPAKIPLHLWLLTEIPKAGPERLKGLHDAFRADLIAKAEYLNHPGRVKAIYKSFALRSQAILKESQNG